jgi:NAD+ synthase (glutamine-hydrolysing)
LDLLRIGTTTLNQTPLDFDGNKNRIIAALAEAVKNGVQVLCLPELAVSGYGCEDAFFSLSTIRQSEKALKDILPHTKNIAVLIGLPIFHQGGLYNSAAMVCDGKILGVSAKRQLPREGVHYEPRWFRPWPEGRSETIQLCGAEIPFGDHHYKFGNVGIGVEICEEAWGSSSLIAPHMDDLDIVLNPSASHFALGKCTKREVLVANASRALKVFYAYSNLVGLEAGRIIYDGGCMVAFEGGIVKRGERFSFNDFDLCWHDANLDLARVDKMRSRAVQNVQTNLKDGPNIVKVIDLPKTTFTPESRAERAPESELAVKRYDNNEEFLKAEILGLFDYLRKSGSKGFVVSLSGGCDSSATASLVAHTIAQAVNVLGIDQASKRLGVNSNSTAKSAKELIQNMLICLYQKTENSGSATEGAAKGLAEQLGAKYHSVDVQPMIDSFLGLGKDCIGRELEWEKDDLPMQNIQARTRAPLAWLLANINNFLLLTTSNRSEASVGYATMDGDTAGGLAPLGGIDKPFLRDWLKWAEKDCALGLGSISSLNAVNEMEPTAELRPKGNNQTDEADLMPYEILERIERYLVRDRMGIEDILDSIKVDYPERKEDELKVYLNRFMDLWRKTQWKRERLAPSFHLDDESVDPKTWCRYPILSGTVILK